MQGDEQGETCVLVVEDTTSNEELDRFILETLSPKKAGSPGTLSGTTQVDSFVLQEEDREHEYQSYSPPQSQFRVLVVEDHIPTQNLERFILEEAGYEVSAVVNGEDALQAVINSAPGIVLMDLELTGMDGFTTCQRVRELSDVPIIVVTGRDCVDDQVRALQVGADDYLIKPFLVQELAGRVAVLLRLSNRENTPSALREELDELHEGSIRLVVEVSASIRKAINLVGDLRDHPQIHMLRVVSKRGYMDISMRLACPLPIRRILLHGGNVSKIVVEPADQPYDSVFHLSLS